MTHNPAEALREGLLPCPFCGDTATTVCSFERWYVACTSLHCFCAVGEGYDRDAMPDHSFVSEELAIAAWNRRAALTSPAPAGGEGLREIGWLAELQGNTPSYWEIDLASEDGGGWTPDANKALRFARRVDAESFIADIGWTEVQAVEHMWLGPILCPSTLTDEKLYTQAELDECGKIGERDGYEKAVQDIDQLTGGDGEYVYCMGHDSDRHCPDAEAMKARIVARFEALDTSEPVQELHELPPPSPDVAGFDPAKDLEAVLADVISGKPADPELLKAAEQALAAQDVPGVVERLRAFADDYVETSEIAKLMNEAATLLESLSAEKGRLVEALKPFGSGPLPSSKKTEIAFDRHGLRRSMSPLEIARLNAERALTPKEKA